MKSPKLKVLEVDIDSIKPHPKNPHKIDDKDVKVVQASIQQFGYVQPIAIWTDNIIRIGHTRWQAAKQLGLKKISVVVLDHLTQEQADALLAVDNQTHAGFTWDYSLLAELIDNSPEIDWGQYFSSRELASLMDADDEQDEPDVGGIDMPPTYSLVVNCSSEAEQSLLFEDLKRRGYDVHVQGDDN